MNVHHQRLYRRLCWSLFALSLAHFCVKLIALVVARARPPISLFPRPNTQPTNTNERILYIVTSLTEYDNGRRATTEGYDRFTHTMLPVLAESTRSMVTANYKVDLYLVTHYKLSNIRQRQLIEVLPREIGVYVWDDATPLAYQREYSDTHIQPHTRGLARQHRFIVKDFFFHYDLFVNFEDDMLIRAESVSNYLDVSATLSRLRTTAPTKLAHRRTIREATDSYYGQLTQQQLARTIPGFIRVEHAPKHPNPDYKPRIPFFDKSHHHVNASACCAMTDKTVPSSTDLYFWETSIEALGIRHMPDLDWVVLLGGNNNEKINRPNYILGDYWAGKDYYKIRPDRKRGRFLSNQGGWMGTRQQIVEWHGRWCLGGFLPPYDLPFYKYDGLDARSVEYWSGGIQLVGVNACNLQRIIGLTNTTFSSSLLYHTSNNKQRQKKTKHQFSTNIEAFWSQLQTIQQKAEQEIVK